jgi:hypothetical protein
LAFIFTPHSKFNVFPTYTRLFDSILLAYPLLL